MPPRLDIVGLVPEEKRDGDDVEGIKYAALSPYHDFLLYSMSPREPLAVEALTKAVRRQLSSAGTSLEINDKDPTGDGDQSPIIDPYSQLVFRNLFQSGGDFDEHLPQACHNKRSSGLSEFAMHCVTGHHYKVNQMLEKSSVRSGKSLDVMVQLLETRETALRLSPLLLVVCRLYRLALAGGHGDCVVDNGGAASKRMSRDTLMSMRSDVTAKGSAVSEKNLLKVVGLLLLHGARPDAKDVAGCTVCHYGASAYANDASLAATTMCIGAAISAHCFGREVVLRDMDDSAYNGMRGLAAGYQAETGRRIVYLFGRKSEIAVMNRNIRLVLDPSKRRKVIMMNPPKNTFNLCDAQNRLGRVCLAELFDSNRVDVAKFLMHKHEASIDIPDWNGETLRFLSLACGSQMAYGVAPLIASEAMKRARQQLKKIMNICAACGRRGDKERPLQVCQPCMSVRYCSDACQNSDWKNRHRKDCRKLRKAYTQCIVIDKPSTGEGDVADNAILTYNAGEVPMTSYRRPCQSAVGETFTVKVQRVSGRDTLLVTDKSRECMFFLGPDQKFYKMLLDKVKAEQGTAGTKTHMAVAFDAKGNCAFYVNQTKLKSW